jgi:hypothetical protein
MDVIRHRYSIISLSLVAGLIVFAWVFNLIGFSLNF